MRRELESARRINRLLEHEVPVERDLAAVRAASTPGAVLVETPNLSLRVHAPDLTRRSGEAVKRTPKTGLELRCPPRIRHRRSDIPHAVVVAIVAIVSVVEKSLATRTG
jgi:hypothetical protein